MTTEHGHASTLITRMLLPSYGFLLGWTNGPSTKACHATVAQPGHGAIPRVVDAGLDVSGVEAWTLPHSLMAELSPEQH